MAAIVAAGALGVGCSDKHKDAGEQEGKFSLNLATHLELTPMSASGQPLEQSRSLDLTPPDVNDFHISIQNASGETVREWERYESMPAGVLLKEGNYTLSADYGEPAEGGFFGTPQVAGTTEFTVVRQQNNPVSLVCKVANVVVTVDYTDGFKGYFSDYTLTVHSGETSLDIAKGETRPACFDPGTLLLSLALTKQDGTELTVAPAALTGTKAGEHYRLKFDVGTDGAGGASLLLTFSDQFDEESISISLSSGMLQHPSYTLAGFDSGDILDLFDGEVYTQDLSALVTSRSPIASCLVRTESDALKTLGWPEDGFELVGINATDKATLKGFGFRWTESLGGLNMAVLDFKGFTEHMPAGATEAEAHKITVVTTDRLGGSSDPLELTFRVTPPQFELLTLETTGQDKPIVKKQSPQTFGVNVTSGNPEKVFFEYKDPIWQKWVRVSSQFMGLASGDMFAYTLNNIDWNNVSVQIRAGYTGRDQYSEILQYTQNPTLSISAGQVFAHSAEFSVDGPGADAISFDANDYQVEMSTDAGVTWNPLIGHTITSNGSKISVKASGLTAGTTHRFKVTYNSGFAELGPVDEESANISTEAALPVPNGDFSAWETPTEYANIWKGGRTSYYSWGAKWKEPDPVSIFNYQLAGSSGWKNVNDKTVPAAPTIENTWYMVPSTLPTTGYGGSNGVMIRNVAWHNDAERYSSDDPVPPNTAAKLGGGGNEPVPPTDFKRSVGKLFLGTTYTYNHSTGVEKYTYGVPFTSRPAKLKGYYKYKSVGGDKAVVHVKLIGGTFGTTTLAEKKITLDAANDYIPFDVELDYSNSTKAKKLQITITSSDKYSDNQDQENGAITTNNDTSNMISVGSELCISDLEFEYN